MTKKQRTAKVQFVLSFKLSLLAGKRIGAFSLELSRDVALRSVVTDQILLVISGACDTASEEENGHHNDSKCRRGVFLNNAIDPPSNYHAS